MTIVPGIEVVITSGKPAWWRLIARRKWRKFRGAYHVSSVISGVIIIE